MNESSVFWIRSWAFFSAELYRSFIYTELFSLILSSIELDTLLTLLSSAENHILISMNNSSLDWKDAATSVEIRQILDGYIS